MTTDHRTAQRAERRTDGDELHDVPAPVPQGAYRSCALLGDLVITAGMTPRVAGVLQHPGRVGAGIDMETARTAARIAARNALAAVRTELGSLDDVHALRLTVYVAAVAGFTDHSRVADAASATLAGVLGPRGSAARSAVGVLSLPGGACVEVELTAMRVRGA